MKLCLIIFAALLGAAGACAAEQGDVGVLAITSRARVFCENESPAFSVFVPTAARFVCRDFWGRECARGELEAAAVTRDWVGPRLPPGWYEMELSAGERRASSVFGVVVDRGNRASSPTNRVATDAASAWLLKDESKRAELADLLHEAGIAWVRERTSWTNTEKAPGRYDWRPFQSTIDTLAARGVHISQMWHDSPPWTRPNRHDATTPDDLRDLYRWLKDAAARFDGKIQAWEIWNEMELPNFWTDLGDRYAALEKAAYWAVKDGSPDALVVMGGLAVNPPGLFARSFYESGGHDYADRFNWHVYTAPESYAGMFANHRALQKELGVKPRPAWITEAGVLISGNAGAGKQLLDEAGQRAQALYAAQSLVSSLAIGTERHFFFVLVDYLENGVQFGALHPDLSPYPSFLAVSAVANLLGESVYAGDFEFAEGVAAPAFQTDSGMIVAVSSAQPQTIALTCRAEAVQRFDLFAAETRLAVHDGKLPVSVGPEITYLKIPAPDTLAGFRPAVREKVSEVDAPRSRVVLSGTAELPVSKENNSYRLGGPGVPVKFKIEVYNFDAVASRRGEVRVVVPDGWRASPQVLACTVGAMGRFSAEVSLVPDEVRVLAPLRVVVEGSFVGETVAPSVSYFLRDAVQLSAERTLPLALPPATQWDARVAPVGHVAVTDMEDGLEIAATFSGQGDRWAYPEVAFVPRLDLSAYDGLAFTLEPDAPTPNSWMRIQLVEEGGSVYFTGTQDLQGGREHVLLFADLKHMGFSPTDANGQLDLDRIVGIKVGLNTPGDAMKFKITGLRAVRFARAESVENKK